MLRIGTSAMRAPRKLASAGSGGRKCTFRTHFWHHAGFLPIAPPPPRSRLLPGGRRMMKRVVAISLVLVGAIWLASRSRPSGAHAAGDVTVLQPVRSFQVHGLEGFRLNDVGAYNGDLFLLLKDPSGNNEILRINGNGDILAKIPLPSTQMFKQLRVSQSGTLAVSLPHYGSNPLTTIFLYTTEGALKASFDVPLFNEIAFVGDDLVGLDHSGIVRLTSHSQFVPAAGALPLVLLDPGTPVMTASLAQDRLAIVEIVSGRLQIAAVNAVLAGPMVLYAPEIQGVQRPQVENGWAAVVSTVTSNPAGDLYLGITGGKRQEGAPVLQFDSIGNLKNRLKCILPTFGLDPSDHQSYMYAAKLVATNDSLYWISVSEKKFAAYSLGSLN